MRDLKHSIKNGTEVTISPLSEDIFSPKKISFVTSMTLNIHLYDKHDGNWISEITECMQKFHIAHYLCSFSL